MLLPIKPVGILPNFLQQQDPDMHIKKKVLCYISNLMMIRENHVRLSFLPLFHAGRCLSIPFTKAKHCRGWRHLPGDHQTPTAFPHGTASPLGWAQLLHGELGKSFSRNGLSAQTVSHQLKLKWFWGGYGKC